MIEIGKWDRSMASFAIDWSYVEDSCSRPLYSFHFNWDYIKAVLLRLPIKKGDVVYLVRHSRSRVS